MFGPESTWLMIAITVFYVLVVELHPISARGSGRLNALSRNTKDW